MKKLVFLFTFCLLLSCSEDYQLVPTTGSDTTESLARVGQPQHPYIDPQTLFSIDKVPTITLQFSVAEWNKLLTNYDLNPKNEKKVTAAFTYVLNGQTTQLDSIALKLKGNTSRRRPEGDTGELHSTSAPDWHHCHFALDFSKNRPNQLFAGRNKLDLKWFKDDSSYAREIYSYDLFRRYGVWTAPRASYTRVKIKVDGTTLANYGVYAMIEHVDEDYIGFRKNYWTPTIGDLWKGGYGSDGLSANFVQTASMGIEDVTLNPNTSVYYAYDLKTNDDNLPAAKANLQQFIADLNTKTGADFKNWISSKMDIRLFMKTYATSVMLGMWDDYWVNANNFYFYFAGNGKAYFIPYDYDNTLGTSLLLQNSGLQNPLIWGPANNRPLIT
ncbi:MAG TPA: CotH kinase family protein, partial [Flavobacterium sp.]|nr:CotH kinase family protein [Flavobacterium sp.]